MRSWTVTKTFVSRTTFVVQSGENLMGVYRLRRVHVRSNAGATSTPTIAVLRGEYIEYDRTGGGSETRVSVELDFASPVAGVFKIASPEEDDADTPLFSFDLRAQTNATEASARVFVSFSPWHGALGMGSCQLSVIGVHAFTLTVMDGDDSVMLIAATKVPPTEVPTLWQTWGNMGMIVAFFLVQTWVRAKSLRSHKDEAPPRPKAGK